MFREILPNMASIVMITLIGSVIFGIGAQAGLEFLGLGDVSVVSWGTNLYWASNDGALMSGTWWAFVPSGACHRPRGLRPGADQLRRRRGHQPPAALHPPAQDQPPCGARLGNPPGGEPMSTLPSSRDDAPVLEVADLSVEYHGEYRTVRAVDRVSFQIGSGEIFGLAGESGCGKSTAANAIMRLLRAAGRDHGRVHPVPGTRHPRPGRRGAARASGGGRSRWSSSRP